MIAVCSDLDRTLIYSHRFSMPPTKIVAEYYDGRVQSYMTARSFHFLQNLRGAELFPVTTRTPEQFARIHVFGGEIPYRAALTCNGAILYDNGDPDAQWLADTMRIGAASFPEVKRIFTYLQVKYGAEHLHYYEPYFTYRVCENAQEIAAELRRVADLSCVFIHADRRKVYCYPRGLDKGNAIRRLRKRFGITKLLAAGDSVFDVPMLDAADFAFAPARIRNYVSNVNASFHEDEIISDAFCDFIRQHI